MPGTRGSALLALVVLLVAPTAAHTQDPRRDERDREPSRLEGSIALLNTQPLGELATGPGFGLALGGAYILDRTRIFRIHGEFRAAIYDHERQQVCFSSTVGCRVRLDLTTDYSIVYAGLGPQVALPIGPTRLVLDATLGWGGIMATSSLSGVDDDGESIGDTTNYEDHTLAWSTGAELRIPITHQIALSLGAAYQRNGTMSYVREGGIIDNPDGSLSFEPFHTEANLVAIMVGVAVGR